MAEVHEKPEVGEVSGSSLGLVTAPRVRRRPRGICKECGAEVAVKRDGTMQGHGYRGRVGDSSNLWCEGSGQRGWKLHGS